MNKNNNYNNNQWCMNHNQRLFQLEQRLGYYENNLGILQNQINGLILKTHQLEEQVKSYKKPTILSKNRSFTTKPFKEQREEE